MKKEFAKQALIGIAGLLVTGGIFALCYTLWHTSVSQLVIDAFLAVFAAAFFGFLCYIFGGRKGFINGAVTGLVFVALTAAAHELPPWAFGCLILAAVAFFVLRPLIKQYKTDHVKNGGKVRSQKIAQEIIIEEAAAAEQQRALGEFEESIGIGAKSLLVLTSTGGIYQLIKSGGSLYFLRVGGQLNGIDDKLMRTDFSDESSFLKSKKDFRLSPNEISSISFKPCKLTSVPYENS